ncbi:pleiotropic regulatory protein RsmS [Shewanella pneumatophori]|uniref:Pleiotropic regulatory protein RsmS n=1 Tax=Shewanella pneumatophori TaxID=314092 RepID=A0A9X1ZMU3_9GAMM|nr:pleiotropic regulatory protein RsmS [Shewanella pneumatophori]MCL1138546.1 pleiotropic regulatory protein RsmS [Shewanella pneumatophori]
MNEELPVSGLANAAEEVKLAVDLIFLLESNNIDTDVALAALEIVKQDLQAKR